MEKTNKFLKMSVFSDIERGLKQAIAYEKGELVLQSSLTFEEIERNFENAELLVKTEK